MNTMPQANYGKVSVLPEPKRPQYLAVNQVWREHHSDEMGALERLPILL